MFNFLKSYKTNGEYISHTTLSPAGRYFLNRDVLEEMFKLHSKLLIKKPDYVCTLAELPSGKYTMLRFDIDIKEKSENDTIKELYTSYDVLSWVQTIQTYLKTNLQQSINKIQANVLDCCVLAKKPYLDKGILKHGLHLQFPNCFLSINDSKAIHSYMKKHDSRFDNIASHPWLLYGCRKSVDNDSYRLDKIITHELKLLEPKQYFKSYKIYDDKEQQIKFIKPIVYYYPRILSIHVYNRHSLVYDLKPTHVPKQITNKFDFKNLEETNSDIEEYHETISELIENYLHTHNMQLEINDTTKFGYSLSNVGGFICPISGKEHTRIGAFVSVFNSCAYFGCYKCKDSNNKSTIKIGSYKKQEFDKNDIEDDENKEEANFFLDILKIPQKNRSKEQQSIVDKQFQLMTAKNIEYMFNTMSPYDPDSVYSPVKQDKKGYCGMTYREIYETDYSFAQWMIAQNNFHSMFFQNCEKGKMEDDFARIKLNDKFVDKNIYKTDTKVIIVKAGLGRGKTQSITEHMNENAYDRIVVLTPRRTYAKSCLERLKKFCPQYEWILYMNRRNQSLIKDKYIIIQCESIHKLFKSRLMHKQNTLLLIDEVEAFLYQLTSVDTHKNNHIDNIQMFDWLCNNSRKIIAVDAFVSRRTLNVFQSMKVQSKFYEYTRPLEERTCRRIVDTEDDEGKILLTNEICTVLQDNKKVFFFCSSVTKLTEYFIPEFEKNFPRKKILQYHSNSVKSINELINVNSLWSDADLICCTSSITVGLNFDMPNVIYKQFCYASASSKNIIRDVFQSLYRVRYPIDTELVYYLDTRRYGVSLTAYKSGIEKQLQDKITCIQRQKTNYDITDPNEKPPEFLFELVSFNNMEHSISQMNMEELFLRYLKACNYKHVETNEDYIQIAFSETERYSKIEYEYETIPDIDSAQMTLLRNKRLNEGLDPLESAMLEKFFFVNMINNKHDLFCTKILWMIYLDHGKGKFMNLAYEKGLMQDTLTISDTINSLTFEVLNKGLSLQLEAIHKIKTLLNINCTQDKMIIKRSLLAEKLDELNELRIEIKSAFTLRDESKNWDIKNCVKFLSSVFRKWGYSHIIKEPTRKRLLIDGKKIDNSDFIIKRDTAINVVDCLKPKSIKTYKKRLINTLID